MKFLLFNVMILSTCLVGFTQQTGKIEGKITYTDEQTPFSGIPVYLEGTNISRISDAEGRFVIENINPGTYNIVILSEGYQKIKYSVIVSEESDVSVNITMKENLMNLPDLVVKHITMTGGTVGLQDMPGSAYYITPKELQKFSNTDLNRTLRNVPGVNIQEEDGFGLRPNIGLRGSGVERSNKVTIMEDGILMAPAPYAAPAAYYAPTFGRMQGVEIMKGSSQIKYGPYTTGGAINFISSQIPTEFSGKIALNGGSFGNRNAHMFVGNSHEIIGYSIEGFSYGSNGFKTVDGTGKTGFNKNDVIAKVRVNTRKNAKIQQSLTLKAGLSTELSHETYLGLSLEDYKANPLRRYAGSQMDYMETSQKQFSATHIIQPAKFLNITTTGYINDFSRNWYKLDGVTDSTGKKYSISQVLMDPTEVKDAYDVVRGQSSINSNALYVKGNNRSYRAQGIQTVIGFDFTTGTWTHDIDLGFRYHQDFMDRFQYEDQYSMVDSRMFMTLAGEPGRESNRFAVAKAAASYIQYSLKYKGFTFRPGIRHEYILLKELDYGKNDPERIGTSLTTNTNQTSTFIPGISIDYKINKSVSTFAGVHKGFAPAGTNPDANPEESVNYELGGKFQFKGFYAQLVGFYNDYKNLLGADLAAGGGTGSGLLFNGGRAKSQGIEALVQYDVLHRLTSKFNLPVSIAYTYTDALFLSSFSSTFEDWGNVTSGDHLPYLSNHQLAANISLEHSRFAIYISGKYNSQMRGVAGQGAIAEEDLIPAYFILDANIQYHVQKNITLTAGVNNILNENYIVAIRPAGFRSGMPRAFQLGIRATF